MADPITSPSNAASGPMMSMLLSAVKAQPAPERPKPVQSSSADSSRSEDKVSEPSAQTLESAVNTLETHLRQSASELKVQVDESTGRAYLKIIDPNTKKVLLQMPPEEVLATSKRLRELSAESGFGSVLLDREG